MKEYHLEFEAEKHEYKIDGLVYPGITEILKITGLSKDYSMMDPFYRDRGIAVHKAIELWLKDELDLGSLDEYVVPYFDGFLEWWERGKYQKKEVQASETPLWSQRLGFCGTLDLVIRDTIFDFKCSKSPDPVSELQGCGQQILWGENFGLEIPFRVLQLPGNTSHRVIDYQTSDPNLWDAVMSIYNWKTKGKK